jgi:hypothetical protein
LREDISIKLAVVSLVIVIVIQQQVLTEHPFVLSVDKDSFSEEAICDCTRESFDLSIGPAAIERQPE